MSEAERIFELDPRAFTPHALHGHDRDFRESNCYIDLWIGMLHGYGLDPHACLAVTLASDFEGDQWTFFKPSHSDLSRLYGVRVEELTLWRPLVEQVRAQLDRKRIPLVEMDSFFLPDTAASDYKRNHVKTTIGISFMDEATRTLRYFHNAGFYELTGDDFDGIFRIGTQNAPDYLPPYCEIAKADRAVARDPAELRALSRELARTYFELRPAVNPVRAHADQLAAHLQWIVAGGLPVYHGYSFAAMRQLGANFEFAARYLRWLSNDGLLAEAATAFGQLSAQAKMLILKLARVANTRKPTDLSPAFAEMARAWDDGMARLADGLTQEG
jgi:hypothetical protein